MNLSQVLSTHLLDRPCAIYASDMRVKVGAHGLYTYPGVVVVCGEPRFEDAQVDTLLNPTLIIEVLSPSTEAYHRGVKFGYYRALSSLQEYLLVAQEALLVEHYVRAQESWVLTALTDAAAGLPLPAIDCTLPLAEVYRKVVFPADLPVRV